MAGEDPQERQPQSFAWPIIGTLYSSVIAVTVVAILDTDFGRDLQERLDAPARAMVAAPVLLFCVALFCASLVALVAPAWRRPSLRVAELSAWLIPAWLLMSAVILGGIAYALDNLDS
jgi:protein-S-isoprenylcysteine O-methyltransferase Ste14